VGAEAWRTREAAIGKFYYKSGRKASARRQAVAGRMCWDPPEGDAAELEAKLAGNGMMDGMLAFHANKRVWRKFRCAGCPARASARKRRWPFPFYVVWRGRKCGVFHNWYSCEASVANVAARFKGFSSLVEAEFAFAAGADRYGC
jgi:hypothetical protein